MRNSLLAYLIILSLTGCLDTDGEIQGEHMNGSTSIGAGEITGGVLPVDVIMGDVAQLPSPINGTGCGASEILEWTGTQWDCIPTPTGAGGAATSVPVTGIGPGTIPVGVFLPSNQIGTGALNAGVTLATSQLTGTINPATQLGAGNIPSSVNFSAISQLPAPLNGAGCAVGEMLQRTALGWTCIAIPSSADNLGDHTVTQNIVLGSNYLSGDGGNEGVFVNSTGNVGIGTAAPSANLEISNNDNSAGVRLSRVDDASDTAEMAFTPGAALTSSNVQWTVGLTNSGTNNFGIQSWDGTTGINHLVVDNTGNVGIGTTAPTATLHIKKDAPGFETVYESDGSNIDIGYFKGANRRWKEYVNMSLDPNDGSNTGSDYRLESYLDDGSSSVRLFIDRSSGSIGIGTTKPTAELHVSKRTTSGIGMLLESFSYPGILRVQRANGTQATPTAALTGEVLGNISFGGYGTTGFPGNGSVSLKAVTAENFTDIARGTDLTMHTTPLGASAQIERVRITSEGNIGIGTEAPVVDFEVHGEGELLRLVDDTNASNPYYLFAGVNRNGNGYVDIGGFQMGVGYIPLVLNRNGGNVGIGTNSPAVEFDVDTGVINASAICDESNTNCIDLSVGASASSIRSVAANPGAGNVAGDVVYNTTDGVTYVYSGAVWEPMAASGDSNSVVSNANPTVNLPGASAGDIAYNSTSNQLEYYNGSSWGSVSSGGAGDDLGDHTAAQNIVLGSNYLSGDGGNEGIAVDAAGNVGIGTTNPLRKLTVFGNGVSAAAALVNTENSGAYINTLALNRRRADATAPTAGFGTGITFNLESSTDETLLGAGTIGVEYEVSQTNDTTDRDTAMTFSTFEDNIGSEKFRITSSGMVGIGTMSPDEILTVDNGTSIGRYTTTGWTHTSDRRLKRDIASLDNPLEKVLKLEPVEYSFKKDESRSLQLGFIAQKVEEVFPEVVVTGVKGIKSLVYDGLISPLVGAVKELYAMVMDLFDITAEHAEEIAELKEENSKKDLKMQKLENDMAEIKALLKSRVPASIED